MTVHIKTDALIEVPGLGEFEPGEYHFDATDEQRATFCAALNREWPDNLYIGVEDPDTTQPAEESPVDLFDNETADDAVNEGSDD